MSEIYLIRHGQASFGEDNYDRLSPIGIRQARVLARHLVKTGKLFDAVYYGEMERQQKTAQEFVEHCNENKIPAPRPVTSSAFNEYDSSAVWQALIPELLREKPDLAGDLAKIPGDRKVFQKVFSEVMTRWVAGDYKAVDISRWDEYARCVRQGIGELMTRHGVKKRLAVFTSGGPISVAVQEALDLSDQKTLEVAWQLLNASITRIKYNRHGIVLAGFNDVTHLEMERDEKLLTYR